MPHLDHFSAITQHDFPVIDSRSVRVRAWSDGEATPRAFAHDLSAILADLHNGKSQAAHVQVFAWNLECVRAVECVA